MKNEFVKNASDILKKVWHFLIYEDSWESFIVDALLILIIAKFLVFPGIGLALHTDYPVVAVVSNSMDHHDMNFETWWQEKGDQYEKYKISETEFIGFYKENGFQKGDLFVVNGYPPDEIEVGDIIVYNSGYGGNPIIHRVVNITEQNNNIYFETKGDANSGQLDFEKKVSTEQVYGKAVAMVPKIGWVKVAFVELISAVKKR